MKTFTFSLKLYTFVINLSITSSVKTFYVTVGSICGVYQPLATYWSMYATARLTALLADGVDEQWPPSSGRISSSQLPVENVYRV